MFIVLLHGLFGFRAQSLGPLRVEYFPGIADALRQAGHEVATTGVNPLGGIAQRAGQLQQQLHAIVDPLPQGEKILLIAHSMGGLDARHLLTDPASTIAPRVAALVTIATPHLGSPIADLLMKISKPTRVDQLRRLYDGARESISQFVAQRLAEIGLPAPEWLQWFGLDHDAIEDLTTESCAAFNQRTPNHPHVRYFWVAADCTGAVPFFMKTAYDIIDNDTGPSGGPNDGAVAVKSAQPPADVGNPWTSLGTWPVDHFNAVNVRIPGDKGRPDVAAWYVDLVERVVFEP